MATRAFGQMLAQLECSAPQERTEIFIASSYLSKSSWLSARHHLKRAWSRARLFHISPLRTRLLRLRRADGPDSLNSRRHRVNSSRSTLATVLASFRASFRASRTGSAMIMPRVRMIRSSRNAITKLISTTCPIRSCVSSRAWMANCSIRSRLWALVSRSVWSTVVRILCATKRRTLRPSW